MSNSHQQHAVELSKLHTEACCILPRDSLSLISIELD